MGVACVGWPVGVACGSCDLWPGHVHHGSGSWTPSFSSLPSPQRRDRVLWAPTLLSRLLGRPDPRLASPCPPASVVGLGGETRTLTKLTLLGAHPLPGAALGSL